MFLILIEADNKIKFGDPLQHFVMLRYILQVG